MVENQRKKRDSRNGNECVVNDRINKLFVLIKVVESEDDSKEVTP